MVFPVGMYGMWEMDHQEGWALKNWCFWTVVLEKTLESPLDGKEIKPVNQKVNESGIFIGSTDVEYFGHMMQRAASLKDPDAGKDWRQEEKGTTEDEMVGCHTNSIGMFEQALGDDERQGSLAVLPSMGSQRARHDWATEKKQETKILHATWHSLKKTNVLLKIIPLSSTYFLTWVFHLYSWHKRVDQF